MIIWLVTIGEPIPVQEGIRDRLHRTGYFAHYLADQGHDVIWWTSTFDHFRKKHMFDEDTTLQVNDCLQIRLIHGGGYKSNVSIARLRDHRRIACRFAKLARRERNVPDIIVAALPAIGLCLETVRYGRERDVPVVLDIRDMWPEHIVDLAPRWLRGTAALALSPLSRSVANACSDATAILGSTPDFVEWGLSYANRPRNCWDRDFPMAYDRKRPADDALQDARDFWSSHGITPSEKELTACFFGAMGKYSEIQTVIEAARQLSGTDCRIRFVLCGTGDRLERHRKQAQELDNVLLPGWVNATQIWELMQMSSIALAPYVCSRNYIANLPNKPVEYLSGGLPIVTSLRGVLSKLLHENQCGMLYEAEQPEQLAAALAGLYEDRPRLATMSRNARCLFESRFTKEAVFDAFVDHLEQIVAST